LLCHASGEHLTSTMLLLAKQKLCQQIWQNLSLVYYHHWYSRHRTNFEYHIHTYTHTHIHTFNGVFSRTTWVSRHQKGKQFWILLKQEMMGWQWHQRGHMQIICTTLQTDNHASTPPLNFLQAGCSSWRPTNSVKALKAVEYHMSWLITYQCVIDVVIWVTEVTSIIVITHIRISILAIHVRTTTVSLPSLKERSYHSPYLISSDLISTDFISSEWSGSECTVK